MLRPHAFKSTQTPGADCCESFVADQFESRLADRISQPGHAGWHGWLCIVPLGVLVQLFLEYSDAAGHVSLPWIPVALRHKLITARAVLDFRMARRNFRDAREVSTRLRARLRHRVAVGLSLTTPETDAAA